MSKDQDSVEERVGFRDFQKHCKECRRDKFCGKYHVYVMKLDKAIYQEVPKFRTVNPGYIAGKDCYYVGMTKHHPRCRQSMHQVALKSDADTGAKKAKASKKAKAVKEAKAAKWRCYCGVAPGLNEFNSTFNKSSKLIKGYTAGHLKKERFAPHADKAAAEEAEKKLAADLRKQGFAVWAGHHDAETLKQQKKVKKPSKKAGN